MQNHKDILGSSSIGSSKWPLTTRLEVRVLSPQPILKGHSMDVKWLIEDWDQENNYLRLAEEANFY